ncbi:MAG: helix-turn-helix domain-containing protein [Proteobacteria bacterium]|nr:helix-turn-helix domain-containing protein [Pseudomonadota bacterium]
MIPGASFQWVADSGPSFGALYRHLVLDGMILSHLEVDQASTVTVGKRLPGFSIWHLFSPLCAANGHDIGADELAMVRPGEGGTMRSVGAAHVRSFALEPSLFAEAPELDMPFGPSMAPRAGRWRAGSVAAGMRFAAQHETVMQQLDQRPELLKTPTTRIALRNAILEAVTGLGEAGNFRADRAAVGRHTRIMLRFEEVVEDASDEPMSMVEICRRAGASRRLLEAVVQARTGKPPWEYLRWRRLWRARSLLSRPDAQTTVTSVAFRLGFWHLGRFAAAYAATFGERPSRTLARAGGGPRARRPNYAPNG